MGKYEKLRDAVLAYNAAIMQHARTDRRTRVVGVDLDTLYSEMLAAAGTSEREEWGELNLPPEKDLILVPRTLVEAFVAGETMQHEREQLADILEGKA
jgi:hypothetical protein